MSERKWCQLIHCIFKTPKINIVPGGTQSKQREQITLQIRTTLWALAERAGLPGGSSTQMNQWCILMMIVINNNYFCKPRSMLPSRKDSKVESFHWLAHYVTTVTPITYFLTRQISCKDIKMQIYEITGNAYLSHKLSRHSRYSSSCDESHTW